MTFASGYADLQYWARLDVRPGGTDLRYSIEPRDVALPPYAAQVVTGLLLQALPIYGPDQSMPCRCLTSPGYAATVRSVCSLCSGDAREESDALPGSHGANAHHDAWVCTTFDRRCCSKALARCPGSVLLSSGTRYFAHTLDPLQVGAADGGLSVLTGCNRRALRLHRC